MRLRGASYSLLGVSGDSRSKARSCLTVYNGDAVPLAMNQHIVRRARQSTRSSISI